MGSLVCGFTPPAAAWGSPADPRSAAVVLSAAHVLQLNTETCLIIKESCCVWITLTNTHVQSRTRVVEQWRDYAVNGEHSAAAPLTRSELVSSRAALMHV